MGKYTKMMQGWQKKHTNGQKQQKNEEGKKKGQNLTRWQAMGNDKEMMGGQWRIIKWKENNQESIGRLYEDE
jgi:hypothetical protein